LTISVSASANPKLADNIGISVSVKYDVADTILVETDVADTISAKFLPRLTALTNGATQKMLTGAIPLWKLAYSIIPFLTLVYAPLYLMAACSGIAIDIHSCTHLIDQSPSLPCMEPGVFPS
jgi:hypothetical protein